MPSPIGHSLAGVVVAWTADLVPGNRAGRTAPRNGSLYRRAGNGLTLLCAALAALADIDLLSPIAAHRAFTHGAGAVILVTIIAALVTGWVTRSRSADLETGATTEALKSAGLNTGATNDPEIQVATTSAPQALSVVRIALMCGAAYASHVLLDWIAADDTIPYGIRALWPFSSGWYISGWDLFPGTARRHLLSHASLLQNARAGAQEIAILVPLACVAWLLRARALRN